MIHYYVRHSAPRTVKILCSQTRIPRPSGSLRVADIDCPECIRILIPREEKRIAVLKATLERVEKDSKP